MEQTFSSWAAAWEQPKWAIEWVWLKGGESALGWDLWVWGKERRSALLGAAKAGGKAPQSGADKSSPMSSPTASSWDLAYWAVSSWAEGWGRRRRGALE